MTEIAAPIGVVFGLVPVTNPVPTVANKTLICLKSRNALIYSTHRMAAGVGERAGMIIRGALERHGAPANLVQWVKGRTSRKRTARFMSHPGVGLVLATGGPSMVQGGVLVRHAGDRRGRRQRAGLDRPGCRPRRARPLPS